MMRPFLSTVLVVCVLAAFLPTAAAAEEPVDLGTASSFAVLAGSAVTNTGPTLVMGNVGVSEGSSITGFPPGIVLGGVIHRDDEVAEQAQSDLTIAYNDAASRTPATIVNTELGGQTLLPGVYTSADGTFEITGMLTLQGGVDDVFIFQTASTLTTASASVVLLLGGVQPCNVFWQIGSSATLGTNSLFVGTILAQASITATTGAVIDGRLLARTGAVTLDTNTITGRDCLEPVVATTPGAPVLSATPGDGEVNLTWTTPNPGSEPITGYKIYRDGELLTTVGLVNAHTDDGLTNGVAYTYEVSAMSDAGEGPKSNEATATPSASTEIPFFPTPGSLILGAAGAIGAVIVAVLVARRRA